MHLRVGLDIGGTKFMVAAADGGGEIISRERDSAPVGLE
jgi:predicted NBD/HSP70 family sugar kinase